MADRATSAVGTRPLPPLQRGDLALQPWRGDGALLLRHVLGTDGTDGTDGIDGTGQGGQRPRAAGAHRDRCGAVVGRRWSGRG